MRCPACGQSDLRVFFRRERAPLVCNQLWPSAAQAREAPMGAIELGICETCGMIHNVAFEPQKILYDTSYENSLHFSPKFQEYAESLAERLARAHALAGKSVVEIGCGKGDFLKMLCTRGGCNGVGFDHSYEGPPTIRAGGASVRFVRDYFDERQADLPADLVCCRHVLEHIPRPKPFLEGIRGVVERGSPGAVFFFEVPNVLFTLRDLGVWDVIYEHCSYFGPASIRRLFVEAGFAPKPPTTAFAEQYLCLEARIAVAAVPNLEPEVARLVRLADRFGEHFREKVAHWDDEVRRRLRRGGTLAVWGAGSKGVTFLNSLEAGEGIRFAVDINPRKTGGHIPGTGQEVVPPEQLGGLGVDTVLVMNPIYENEIRGRLRDLGRPVDVAVV